ncbi:hypothetical protein CEXT_246831 [Caerostris extrusa]|uniref:Uncharacterized protein n=1 Tax=Caerostris extrusa TaxID=172846 RepID=A0AAV4M9Q8_CAEEX|nr:hypothetical protein CEXT_246831 [Caerostris extrusa]
MPQCKIYALDGDLLFIISKCKRRSIRGLFVMCGTSKHKGSDDCRNAFDTETRRYLCAVVLKRIAWTDGLQDESFRIFQPSVKTHRFCNPIVKRERNSNSC